MSRMRAVALGPYVEMPPHSDFSKIPAGVSLESAWRIVGPSVEMNISRVPLWEIIAAAYVEGLAHGAGAAMSRQESGQ